MGFNDILKRLFGNKADRDMKELLPIVSKVNAEWEKIKGVSHDELRQISADLKAKIHAHVKAEEDEIASLKAKWKMKNLRSRKERRFITGSISWKNRLTQNWKMF